MKKSKRNIGFTLVEIIIVIAIIAVLTTLVYASINSAKAQNRDQKRVADISTIQLALEMFFSRNKYYPVNLPLLVSGGYIPSIPDSPNGSDGYNYFSWGGREDKCGSYHLWTTLESKISALSSRKGFDSTSKTVCVGGTNASVNAVLNEKIYDVTP